VRAVGLAVGFPDPQSLERGVGGRLFGVVLARLLSNAIGEDVKGPLPILFRERLAGPWTFFCGHVIQHNSPQPGRRQGSPLVPRGWCEFWWERTLRTLGEIVGTLNVQP
jgi:hypothetical protein